MKYVYILISDENDYYFEQAMLSIISLRMRMVNAYIVLLIDKMTEDSLVGNRKNIINLVDEYKSIEINEKYKKKEKSRWLKTSMRKYLTGDFLFIDCDTIITDNLFDISNLNIDFGAVLNLHDSIYNDISAREILISNEIESSSLIPQKHFNSGVIFCRDIPICHSFFNEWHRLWLIGNSKKIIIDQPSFNKTNTMFGNIIDELDGIFNCQIEYGGISYLARSKIIHYFSSSSKIEKAYLFSNTSMFKNIRKNGITSDIKEKLEDPRSVFNKKTRLIADNNGLKIINSKPFKFFWRYNFFAK